MNALQPLLDQFAQVDGQSLWIADENNRGALAALSNRSLSVCLVSNRFNVAAEAEHQGIAARFSDFDFTFYGQRTSQEGLRHVFYRVSKERPVANHIINSAFELLPQGGILWLSGQKNEGIKTYFKQASSLFNSSTRLQKEGDVYWGGIEKCASDGRRLDDRDYRQLRLIDIPGEEPFISKPGTYGWDKIDKGSELLASTFKQAVHGLDLSDKHFLDLGCGYGYLTIQCRGFNFASMSATDNNAAALLCLQANAEKFAIPVKAEADDCGAKLPASFFDIILCNPPFHQGFAVDSDMTAKFLRNTRRLLAKNGQAWFVVNAFIPLEQKAQERFADQTNDVTLVANSGQFKVVRITKG